MFSPSVASLCNKFSTVGFRCDAFLYVCPSLNLESDWSGGVRSFSAVVLTTFPAVIRIAGLY